MLAEKDLIPFSTSALPDGPWLVFAPHPDDETFGMGGSLLLAQRSNIEVDIVFVTDGALADSSKNENLARVREDEALRVCQQINIRQCFFWHQADRGLRVTDRLFHQVAEQVHNSKPNAIFVPSCLELHPDHRATTLMVWKGLQQVPDFTGNVFTYDIGTQGPVNLMVDISEVLEEKRTLMEIYQSQVSTHRYIELVESLDRARTFTLDDDCRAAEGFYRMPVSRVTPFEEALLPWFQRYVNTSEWDNAELVSVVVRTKNRVTLLSQALSSLALQNYPRIEVIVVNDGGEDVSAMVDEFRDRFESIQYVVLNPAKGRAAAANAGLEKVSGAYFMFLDDDDWLDTSHIGNLMRAHREEKTLVAYTGIRTVGVDGSVAGSGRVFNSAFDRNRLYFQNYIPIHAAMISRSVIDSGYRFDPALEVFEDWDFWLQLLRITIGFKHVDAITGYYRVGEGHGIGDKGGYPEARRLIYSRWSKTWGIDEIDDLLTRLVILCSRDNDGP